MNHYGEILSLYKATKKLWEAVNTITEISEPAYNALVSLEQAGKQLMWNAYRYGISASNSAKYKNKIEALADAFSANAYKDISVAQAAGGPMRELRTALTNYIPRDVASQVKSKVPANVPSNSVAPTSTPGAAQEGRSAPDVKIDEPKTNLPQPTAHPSDILKALFGRELTEFYSIPKWKYDEEKPLYDKAGYHYVHGIGLVPNNQMEIAKRIVNEGDWSHHPKFGWLSPKELAQLQANKYV
jgi:hypothetical protein